MNLCDYLKQFTSSSVFTHYHSSRTVALYIMHKFDYLSHTIAGKVGFRSRAFGLPGFFSAFAKVSSNSFVES